MFEFNIFYICYGLKIKSSYKFKIKRKFSSKLDYIYFFILYSAHDRR